MTVYDDTPCLLGEGPLWHPGRGELFWFDIYARTLRSKGRHWRFDDLVTAAGWVDDDTLIVASDRALLRFGIRTGAREVICPLDAGNPATRSNDGRADPQGGFWIGTMGRAVQDESGAIWRYYRGEVRCLYPGLRIPNAICFAPDGQTAYFSDTRSQIIHRVALDRDGWPVGDPQVHVDLRGTGYHPDGAVVAADGTLWNAQWGSYRVAVYDLAGREIAAHALPAAQTSCPAFGGADLTTLYVTSAAAALPQAQLAAEPWSGCTFALVTATRGQREHRVIL